MDTVIFDSVEVACNGHLFVSIFELVPGHVDRLQNSFQCLRGYVEQVRSAESREDVGCR